MANKLLEYILWKQETGGGGGNYEEKTVGPASILHIEDALKRPLTAYTFDVNPVQDLNGQSSPYPAGGGVNKFYLDRNGYYSNSGTFVNSDPLGASADIPVSVGEKYTFGATNIGTKTLALRGYFFDANHAIIGSQIAGAGASLTATVPENAASVAFWFSESGYSEKMTQSECDALGIMIVKGDSLPSTFAPYSNICPISGWKTVNVWNDPKYGGNIEWNQLYNRNDTRTTNGITFTYIGDGKISVSGIATETAYYGYNFPNPIPTNHVVAFCGCPNGGSGTTFDLTLIATPNGNEPLYDSETRLTQKSVTITGLNIDIRTGYDADANPLVFCPQIFDLTAMFGAGNEPSTADEFRALFPKPYYPYNAGEHTCVSAVNGGKYGKYPITFGVLSANKWDEQWEVGTYDASGAESPANDVIRTKNYIPVKPNTDYYQKNDGSGTFVGYWYNAEKQYISSVSGGSKTITSPNDAAFFRFRMSSGYGTTYNHDIAINYPSTVTTYNPYVDTVYSGTVDVVNSTVTVTHEIVTFDGSDSEGWGTYSTTIVRTYRSYSTYGWKGDASCLSNMFANGGETYFPANGTFGWKNEANTFYLQFHLDGITDDRSEEGAAVAKWKAFLAEMASKGTPLTISLALYEPQTFPITPETVITLYKGENNLWADSGDSTGTYVSSDPYKETVGPAQIISVTNALKKPAVSLVASMTPIQDLNGQTSPYPPGGGKNLWNGKFVNTTFVESDSFSSDLFAGNNAMPIKEGLAYCTSLNGESVSMRYVFLDADKNPIGDLTNANYTEAAPVGAVYLRWREIGTIVENGKYQIEEGTTVSAWTPYSNECPISGRTGLTAWRTGKNLFDLPYAMDGATLTYNATRQTVAYENGVLISTMKASESGSRSIEIVLSESHRFMLPNVDSGYFTLSFYQSGMIPNSSNLLRTIISFTDGSYAFGNTTYNDSRFALTTSNMSTLAGKTVKSITIYAVYNAYAEEGREVKIWNLQLEYSATNVGATDYKPRTGATYPVVFPALGKNLFNYKETTPYSSVPLTVEEQSNGYKITISGSGNKTIRLVLGVLSEGQYTFSGVCKDGSDTAKSVYLSKNGATQDAGMTFTADGVSEYGVLFFGSNEDGPYTFTNIQLERSSSATAYEPFTDTVYAGTADVVTGEGMVTQEALTFDNTAWGFSSNFFYRTVINSGINVSAYYTTENGVKIYLNGNNGQGRIYLSDNPFLTSESDIGALLNGYKLIYELQTPKTFTLSPTQIQMLKGRNFMWSDADTLTLTYEAKKS